MTQPRSQSPSGEFRSTLDAVVFENLPPLAAGIGLLYALLALAHLLTNPRPTALTLAALAAMTAVLLFALGAAVDRRYVPLARAHAAGAAISGLALLNCLVELYLWRTPERSASLMVLVIATGCF